MLYRITSLQVLRPEFTYEKQVLIKQSVSEKRFDIIIHLTKKIIFVLSQSLSKLFSRDLDKPKNELATYTNEKNIRIVQDSKSNAAGNYCVLQSGNPKHFIVYVSGV